MMRFIGLAIIILSIPLFHALMRGPLTNRRIGWFCVGLAPYAIAAFRMDVALVSWAMWPGYVKGIIVSLLDTLALAIVLTHREKLPGRPLLWPYLLFMAGTAVATVFATPMEASVFFTWQVARGILVFVAVSKITSRPDGLRYLIGGLAAGIALQTVYALQQRAHGIVQVSGTLGHQNLLGMCTHFALFLSLAAMLAGDRRWLIKLGIACALIVVVLTGSRATTVLAGVGVIALILLSLIRRPTPRKMRAAAIGFVSLLAVAPVALMTMESRFEGSSMMASGDERAAFENAARAMWTDYPMGVGANQYVIKANVEGYSERGGVTWVSGSRGANVHNTYLLLGAETGYLGLGSFLVLLIGAIWRSLRLAWAKPRTGSGEVALGAAVTLCVIAAHLFYEWVFVTWVVQYLFAITLGVISGIAKQQQAENVPTRGRPGRQVDEARLASTWSPVPA